MNESSIRFMTLASAMLLVTGLVMALVLSRGMPEGVFTVHDGRMSAEQGALRLNNRLEINLPDEVLKALNSGVPLVFQVDLHLVEHRPWLWDRLMVDHSRSYRLDFHVLSRSYLLTQLETGKRSIHHILSSALSQMSNHQGLALMLLDDVHPDRDYEVRMRVSLDEASLPSPLQVPVLFSDAWNLDSGWYRWALLR